MWSSVNAQYSKNIRTYRTQSQALGSGLRSLAGKALHNQF